MRTQPSTRPHSASISRKQRLTALRSAARTNRLARNLLESCEPRLLLSGLTLAGSFTSASTYSLILNTDDTALASNGTIVIDWGDQTSSVIHGTANPASHTYASSSPHTITAYAADSLSIATNQTITFNDTGKSVWLLDSLSIAADASGNPLGKLDLTNRDMIIQCPDAATAATMLQYVNDWLRNGINVEGSQIWAGNGIISSNAANDPNLLYAVGMLNNAGDGSLIMTQFDGIPVDSNSIVIKFTYFGDADLSGSIDATDYSLLNAAAGGNATFEGQTWLNGDFDYNGIYDATDYFLLNQAYGSQGTPITAPAGTPKTRATSNSLYTHPYATYMENPIPASGGTVAFTLHFSQPVSGVDPSDFSLATTGTITGASILSVTPIDPHNGLTDSFTILVNPGSGWGSLQLDLNDNDSINDGLGHSMGGTGEGNQYFFGNSLQASTIIYSGLTSISEGDTLELTLGTDFYTAPSDTTWQVSWGDGTVYSQAASTPTFNHIYTSGNGTYSVTIVATTADGEQLFSDVIQASVSPDAPTDVSVTPGANPDQATISWNSLSSLSDQFDLLMSRNGGAFALVASNIPRSARSSDLAGLSGGSDYAFRLVALNAAGAAPAVDAEFVTPGASTGSLDPQDDAPSAYVYLGFTIDFYGQQTDHVYVNNNGNVTLYSAHDTWTPTSSMAAINYPIIAPFFADVDTRDLGGAVSYGPATYEGHAAFKVTWDGVDYFDRWNTDSNDPHQSKTDTFSLYLVSRPDTGPGDFDIIFSYGDLNWDTGDASGGVHGLPDPNNLAAHPARVGYTNGSGNPGTSGELADSGTTAIRALANSTVLAAQIRNTPPTLTVDIDADNNNGFAAPDGNAAERAVKDDPAFTGKLLRDGFHDQDGDLTPDLADGYNLDGVAGNDDDLSVGNFVPLVIQIDAALDLTTAIIRIDYTNPSNPLAVVRTGSGTDDDPYAFTATGDLRLWLKDANVTRDGRSPGSGGDYVAPGIYRPAQLGITNNHRSITLYVEGVHPGAERVVVSVSPTGNLADAVISDAVRATVVDPSPKSRNDWLADVYASLHFDPAKWNPLGGYTGFTMSYTQKIYNFYRDIYNIGAAAFAEKFMWIGLAHRAAGPVLGGLSDAVNEESQLYAWASNPNFNLVSPAGALAASLIREQMHKIEIYYCQGAKAIFDSMSWMHYAYIQKGLDALDEAYFRDHKLTEITPTIYVGWRELDAATGAGDPLLDDATLKFTRFEQKTVLQPYLDKIHAILTLSTAPVLFAPVVFSPGNLLAVFAKNPIAGGDHFEVSHPGGDLTDFVTRFDWISVDILPLWSSLTPAARGASVNTTLASLIGTYATGVPAITDFIAEKIDPLHLFH